MGTLSRLETTPGNRLHSHQHRWGELTWGGGVSGREESQTPSHPWLHLQVPEEKADTQHPSSSPAAPVSPSSTSCPVGLLASSDFPSQVFAQPASHPALSWVPVEAVPGDQLRN